MPIFPGFQVLLSEAETFDFMQIPGCVTRRNAGHSLSGYRLSGAVAGVEVSRVDFPQSNLQLMHCWPKFPWHTITDVGQELNGHFAIGGGNLRD